MSTLKIVIAGLGTVGSGVVNLLEKNAALIAARCGRSLQLVGVCARERSRPRACDISAIPWYDDPLAMIENCDAEIFIELVGGEALAKTACEAALKRGMHVVSANKALLAVHGYALTLLAEEKGRGLFFEAAVAGSIPVIKALREGLGANRCQRIQGILNGTCNYILTQMRETGRSFDSVLSDAQALGYAEAEPSFDVDGIDTAHKIALLSALAFGCRVDFASVYTQGIRHICPKDITYAREMGYEIKLLAIAEHLENGVRQRVHPALVPHAAPLASVGGVYNAVVTETDFAGCTMLEGRGAGAGPTASAVVADIMDIAAQRFTPVFGIPATSLNRATSLSMEDCETACYLRINLYDQPGAMADVTRLLADEEISVASAIQHPFKGHNEGDSSAKGLDLILATYRAPESILLRAIEKIEALEIVKAPICMIRMEEAAQE